MDFYSQIGKTALGSRLRRLSDRLTEDATKIYALYDVALDPKWFPVFYVLSQQESAAITEIAQIIGHSHPSVSQIVKEMNQRGIVVLEKDDQDARVSVVRLSEAGQQLIPKLEKQCSDVTQAVEELLSETEQDLWGAIAAVETSLTHRNFFERVQTIQQQQIKQQNRSSIQIVDYSPKFRSDFKRLNVEWIEKYFQLEDGDYQSLDHPDEKILQPGGHIYIALSDDEAVGTCALIKVNEETYELVKMTVAEKVRGQGIGWQLGQAAINKARELGAKTIFLESNTVLQPAINLYQKLGFQPVVEHTSPYKRCNIQMELKLI